jgi:hypothetical protein
VVVHDSKSLHWVALQIDLEKKRNQVNSLTSVKR